jgi:hypothetical protein
MHYDYLARPVVFDADYRAIAVHLRQQRYDSRSRSTAEV